MGFRGYLSLGLFAGLGILLAWLIHSSRTVVESLRSKKAVVEPILIWESPIHNAGKFPALRLKDPTKILVASVGKSRSKFSTITLLDTRDGKIVWQKRVPGAIKSVPQVVDNTLCVASNSISVSCWDAPTGQMLWSRKAGQGNFAIVENRKGEKTVALLSKPSMIDEFQLRTGKLLSTADLKTKISSKYQAIFTGKPESLLILTEENKGKFSIHAFEVESFKKKWKWDLGNHPMVGEPAIFNVGKLAQSSRAFYLTAGGAVGLFNLHKGQFQWKRKHKKVKAFAPVGAAKGGKKNQHLALAMLHRKEKGDTTNKLVWLDEKAGKITKAVDLGRVSYSKPVAFDFNKDGFEEIFALANDELEKTETSNVVMVFFDGKTKEVVKKISMSGYVESEPLLMREDSHLKSMVLVYSSKVQLYSFQSRSSFF